MIDANDTITTAVEAINAVFVLYGVKMIDQTDYLHTVIAQHVGKSLKKDAEIKEKERKMAQRMEREASLAKTRRTKEEARKNYRK